MIVVKPVTIDGVTLTSSTIAEPDALVGEIEWEDPSELASFWSHIEDYNAAVLAGDGFIYCVGSNNADVVRIDPSNDTVSVVGTVVAGRSYLAAALGNDGNVYCVGTSPSGVMKINISTQAISYFGDYSFNSYQSIVLANDGFLYCGSQALSTAAPILKINTSAETHSYIYGVNDDTGTTAGALAGDGNIYFTGSVEVTKLNISTQTISAMGEYLNNYKTATLADDGDIYCVGDTGKVLKINIESQALTEFGSYNSAYHASALANDGNIYAVGLSNEVLKLNVSEQALSTFGSFRYKYNAMALADNGYIYSIGDAPSSIDPGNVLVVKRSYEAGDQVVKASEHKVYQAVTSTADDPAEGVNSIPPTWIEVSATNRFKAFDQGVSTVSSGTSPLVIELTPGIVVNAIVGLKISGATTINVTMTDPIEGVVYSQDIEMVDNTEIVDWFNYLWTGFQIRTTFALFDLPAYKDAVIKVTFTGASTIDVGVLVTGKSVTLGQANYGSSIQQLDFSTVEEDIFGNLTVIKRPGAKLVNYDVTTLKSQLNYVYRQLDELAAIPTVWVGTEEVQDETIVYGYYRDNNLGIDTPTLCNIKIQVRGLI